MLGGARRGRRHGSWPKEQPAAAGEDHHDRDQLRLGEPERHFGVAAQELHQQALDAGPDQIDAISVPGRQRSRQCHSSQVKPTMTIDS